ncbi:hypothetical protein [Paraburkholderia atlantica]|uniref:hypothetical protein n=1 Tax=Paraburkholderia atlantica TaxID=2654982 RepID=UPI001612E3B4|nr:hypothetical protein [Paraburkholderia atlantica]MBB5418210.1 hypothetical protein [Paraburkholderia atlantica]
MDSTLVVSAPSVFRPFCVTGEAGDSLTEIPIVKATRLKPSTLAATSKGWSGFQECCVCPDDWNVDFAAAYFSPYQIEDEEIISTLTFNVTIQNDAPYPVQATGYVFDGLDHPVGSLDLRYFGQRMPRALQFDVSAYRLSTSSRFLIAFQIAGGGSTKIPRPPLITSVTIDVVACVPTTVEN